MQNGVCLVNTQCPLAESNLVQQAGYKLRAVGTIIPDLLFSKAGTSVAFLLVGNVVEFPWHRFASGSGIPPVQEMLGKSYCRWIHLRS
jgi:hypothetical protein